MSFVLGVAIGHILIVLPALRGSGPAMPPDISVGLYYRACVGHLKKRHPSGSVPMPGRYGERRKTVPQIVHSLLPIVNEAVILYIFLSPATRTEVNAGKMIAARGSIIEWALTAKGRRASAHGK